MIHVDIDPAEVGKNRVPDIPIVGDVKRVLQKLNKALQELEAGVQAEDRDGARGVVGADCAGGRPSILTIARARSTKSSRST